MNPDPIHTSPTPDADAEFDLLLQAHLAAPDEHLTPSSGFALSIMESIHQQATEPRPIAFPWRRVVPGIAAILCTFAAFLFASRTTPAPTQLSITFSSTEVTLVSILLAAFISIITVAASFRLAGRSH